MNDYPNVPVRPFLLVLSGPSGSGKSTVIDGFMANRRDFVRSISVTTRAPRGQERDGVDYFFIDEARLQRLIDEDALLEYAQVFGKHSYGTPRHFVEEQFRAGHSVVMDIDVQGALQIRGRLPERSCLVFVTPPSLVELERRLRGRATDSDEAIARRLVTAQQELAQWRQYDQLVINDQLEQAIQDLQAIVRARELTIARGEACRNSLAH
jgi:guanylate kinase